MVDTPLWLRESTPGSGTPSASAAMLRRAFAVPMMYDGRLVGARQGVRPGGVSALVTLAGSTITVNPMVGLVDPGLSSTSGPYWFVVPSAENPLNGPLQAADATNPRIDIVVARVYDDDEDASGLRLGRTEYIAGTAAPAPSAPAIPSGAFRLATINVPASGGGSAAVTVDCPYTVAAGGILPVRTQAARDALHPYSGMVVWRIDKGWLEQYTGTRWLPADARALSAADLTSLIGSPADGDRAYRTDLHAPLYYHGGMATWVAPGAVPIARNVLAADAASVTFSSIPSDYRHLLLVATGRTAESAVFSDVGLRFNGDTAAHYASSTISGGSLASNTSFGTTLARYGLIFAGATAPASEPGSGYLLIPNYSGTTWKKIGVGLSAFLDSAGLNNLSGTRHIFWDSTAAITSLTVLVNGGANLLSGSLFELYGVS